MGWERKRGKLARAERPAARLDDDRHPDDRAGRVDPADGRALRGHARRRHATAARRGRRASSGRSPIRSTGRPSTRDAGRVTHGYGVLQPRITPTLPAEHEALDLPADLLRIGRHRPVRVGRLRRLPGPVRGGQLHRQGDLRRRRVRRGDGRPGAREHAAEPRPVRGHFARAGLVTDIELFDEFPSDYLVAAARQHRWARGDWQLLPWILGRARDADGPAEPELDPGDRAAGRWSTTCAGRCRAPLALATLVAAWTIPSASAGAVDRVRPRRGDHARRAAGRRRAAAAPAGHLQAQPPASGRPATSSLAAAHVGLGLTFLAHQAWLMVDAIVRTLARLYVTRRHLLEWTTAAQAKASRDLDLARLLPPDGRRRRRSRSSSAVLVARR